MDIRIRDTVRKVLGEKVSVSSLEPRVTLEIRKIYCVTNMGEAKEALRREFTTAGKIKIRVTPENNSRQRVTIIDLAKRDAKLILDKRKMKVGWVVCEFGNRADPPDALAASVLAIRLLAAKGRT